MAAMHLKKRQKPGLKDRSRGKAENEKRLIAPMLAIEVRGAAREALYLGGRKGFLGLWTAQCNVAAIEFASAELKGP